MSFFTVFQNFNFFEEMIPSFQECMDLLGQAQELFLHGKEGYRRKQSDENGGRFGSKEIKSLDILSGLEERSEEYQPSESIPSHQSTHKLIKNSQIQAPAPQDQPKTQSDPIATQKDNPGQRAGNSTQNLPPESLLFLSRLNLYQLKEKLPIYSIKSKFLEAFLHKKEQVLILTGSPGCGKSTQLPFYLLELLFLNSPKIEPKGAKILVIQSNKFCSELSKERLEFIISKIACLIPLQIPKVEEAKKFRKFLKRLKKFFVFMSEEEAVEAVLEGKDAFLEQFCYFLMDEAHEMTKFTVTLLAVFLKVIANQRGSRAVQGDNRDQGGQSGARLASESQKTPKNGIEENFLVEKKLVISSATLDLKKLNSYISRIFPGLRLGSIKVKSTLFYTRTYYSPTPCSYSKIAENVINTLTTIKKVNKKIQKFSKNSKNFEIQELLIFSFKQNLCDRKSQNEG